MCHVERPLLAKISCHRYRIDNLKLGLCVANTDLLDQCIPCTHVKWGKDQHGCLVARRYVGFVCYLGRGGGGSDRLLLS